MSERTEALLKKALAAQLAGRLGAASEGYARILSQNPFDFQVLQLSGLLACQLGRLDHAIGLFGRALKINPKSGSTLIYLGLAYFEAGRNVEAAEHVKAGINLDSKNPDSWVSVGYYLVSSGQAPEALTCFRQALRLNPGHAAAFKGIGDVKQSEGEAAQAVESYRMALRLAPENTDARLGLVQTLPCVNRTAEALAECDRILASQPRNARALSHRLFFLNYQDDLSPERLFAEHQRYGALFPDVPRRGFGNSRDPSRRLRVAFLSQDLRAHSVSFFLEPLLAHLDPSQFEIVLYHDHMRVDTVSDRLRSHAALWRTLTGRSDAYAEGVIRADAPDVMVDLAGHSGQSRLHLFSRRLAPVQVAYLGYPNTTGLPAMDYRFTDGVADPVGRADRLHVERLIRFSPCAWAYLPSAELDAAASGGPAGERDTVAFGSFNSLSKVNDATLRLWSAVMSAVPGSRLVLKSIWNDSARIRSRLDLAGMDPARVTILEASPNHLSHMACYGEIDVALDPFPYGGTTTTCEALWMGRPVVTLAGERHASRVGASLLSAIGRTEWIAGNEEDYVRIARDLAADRPRLRSESLGLRRALRQSPLLDHAGQARRFGDALRACWAHWCETGGDRAPIPSEGVPAEPGERSELALS